MNFLYFCVLFGEIKCYGIVLPISCPRLRSASSPRSPAFLEYLEGTIWKQGMFLATVFIIVSGYLQWTELGCVCRLLVHTDTSMWNSDGQDFYLVSSIIYSVLSSVYTLFFHPCQKSSSQWYHHIFSSALSHAAYTTVYIWKVFWIGLLSVIVPSTEYIVRFIGFYVFRGSFFQFQF